MGESRLPLRVAFWAISAALLLVLLATMSDPHRVRQSLLARRGTDEAPSTTAPEQESVDAVAPSRRPLSTVAKLHETPVRSLDVPLSSGQAAISTETDGTEFHNAGATAGVPAQVVSARELEYRRPITRSVERPAMPILAPGELTGSPSGGRFEELPPPPGMGAPPESIAKTADPVDDCRITRDEELALQRLKLETELLSLRRDFTLSLESRQIEQVQYLQQLQRELLDRQQQTADRLDRLTEQIAIQSVRLGREHPVPAKPQDQAQVPSKSRPVVPGGGAAAGNAAAVLRGAPRIEETADGRRRVTIVVDSDNFAGVVERLNRLSQSKEARTPVARTANSTSTLPPRYLAPPPAHSDPTPLSNSDDSLDTASPEQIAPSRGPTGPVFAAPPTPR